MDEMLHKLFTIRDLDLTCERSRQLCLQLKQLRKEILKKKKRSHWTEFESIAKAVQALTTNLQDKWELVIWLVSS